MRLSRDEAVDEAGAAPTPDLVAIHRRCAQAGAKLLLVGDTRQLAAVGAGGALKRNLRPKKDRRPVSIYIIYKPD